MRVVILGCSSSAGVPVIACECKVCSSDIAYNKRSRCALLIFPNWQEGVGGEQDKPILIDFGCDIRSQILRARVKSIACAILTHSHYDHCAGLDDLKYFAYQSDSTLNIITNKASADDLRANFGYLFQDNLMQKVGRGEERSREGRKVMSLEVISDFEEKMISNLNFRFFRQIHGKTDSLGMRINDFVYSNDVSAFPEESKEYLHNIDVWILDCVRYKANSKHFGLEDVLKLDQEYRPKKMYLTNLSHELEYHKLLSELPLHIEPCYDMMSFMI
ncbi:MBL fold metallo hydrolase family protein [Rickettsiales endosymbiont of Paramecium tredecaurelia]|nr:MBL fold metallo hydrolase family protein [Candidatus Sarmatiella mevalonica]